MANDRNLLKRQGFSSKTRRVDFYADDWIAGTCRLTIEERGVYITACAVIYSHGKPVTKEHLEQLCQCNRRVFDRVLKKLIELRKLFLKNGLISQKRCETELKRARKRIETSQKNGRNGGRPSKEINGLQNPVPRARASPPSDISQQTSNSNCLDADSESEPSAPARARNHSASLKARSQLRASGDGQVRSNGHDRPRGPPPPLPPEQQAMLDDIRAEREGAH